MDGVPPQASFRKVDRDGMCAGPEVAVERDGLLLTGGVTGGRCECATDLLAVDGYRERGIALGIADAIAVGIGILTDLEHQTVGAGAEGDRCGSTRQEASLFRHPG